MSSQPRRRRRRWLRPRNFVLAAILLVIIAGAAIATFGQVPIGGGPEREDEDTTLGRQATVERRDVRITVGAVGNIEPARSDKLVFLTNGELASLDVDAGDQVQLGALLASLQSSERDIAVSQAEEALLTAHLDLAELLKDPDADDLLLAQLALTDAENNLAQLLEFPDPESEITLRQGLISAQTQLSEAAERIAEEEGGVSAEALATATAAFQRAESNLLLERKSYEDFLAGPSELELATARTTLKHEEELLEEYEDSSRTTQTDIDLQELKVIQARQNLETLTAPVDESDKRQRAAAVTAAEQDLESARLRLVELASGDSTKLAQLRLSHQGSLLAVQGALLALEDLLDGPDELEIKAAEATVTRAQIDLRRLAEPPDANQLTKAEISVEQARRNLDRALDQLAGTRLLAPYDGIITLAQGTVGAAPPGEFITIQSSESPQVSTRVSEIDIGRLAIGQRVEINPDVFITDETYFGQITSINPSATSEFGLVTYGIEIAFDSAPENLLSGMTVELQIVLDSAEGVLAIPLAALREEDDRISVELFTGEETEPEERNVETGIRNDLIVEITSGLSEGDVVLTRFESVNEIDLFGGPGGGGGGPGDDN